MRRDTASSKFWSVFNFPFRSHISNGDMSVCLHRFDRPISVRRFNSVCVCVSVWSCDNSSERHRHRLTAKWIREWTALSKRWLTKISINSTAPPLHWFSSHWFFDALSFPKQSTLKKQITASHRFDSEQLLFIHTG